LDAITSQLPADDTGTLVIVQSHRPDPFFTAQQQLRLRELIALWRSAREQGNPLPPAEQAELDSLVDTEELLGLTPTGRATVACLQMNRSAQVHARRLWIHLKLFPDV